MKLAAPCSFVSSVSSVSLCRRGASIAPRLHRSSRLSRTRASMPTSEPETADAGTVAPKILTDTETIASTSQPIDLAGNEDIHASKELFEELVDGSTFGTRGEGWLAAQLAAILMIVAPPAALTGAVDSLALLALAAGFGLMLVGSRNLGRNLSPLPEPRKKHQLVVSGIYGYVRHPMYGGLLAAGGGLAALTHSEGRAALVALLWWVLENKVQLEEKALSERYPEYEQYKTKAKKFFPYIY